MRKLALGLAVAALTVLTAVPALAHLESSKITATFLGKEFDEPVYYHTESFRTYVHGEDLVGILGGSMAYDAATKQVTVKKGDTVIVMTVGDHKTATVNGQPVAIDAGPRDREGEILLPIRFLAEKLGYKVAWHSDRQHVEVSAP